MKIVIRCSESEHPEARDVEGWIRDGEFDANIEVDIEVQS